MSDNVTPITQSPSFDPTRRDPKKDRDRNYDYSPLLGGNILDIGKGKAPPKIIVGDHELTEDPFKNAPPKSDKDYGVYRGYYEGLMQCAQAQQGLQTDEGFIIYSAACEWKDEKLRAIHGRGQMKEEHRGCPFVFACFHIIHADPESPEVVRYIPFERGKPEGYYLCHTCFKLLERCKLDLQNAVCTKCSRCVGESLTNMMQKHPGRFIDLTKVS